MGELYFHDLQSYMDRFGCNVFVETGTGRGTGLRHALKYPFEKYFSIEINKVLFEDAVKQFDKYLSGQLTLVNQSSIDGLRRVLFFPPDVRNLTYLFWLDAHFPGADFQLGFYDDRHPDEIKYPLLWELEAIFNIRPNNRDVFIIDDLQLYEDGNYELKLAPEFLAKHRRRIQPIIDLVNKTHSIRRDYRHQGFMILEPR